MHPRLRRLIAGAGIACLSASALCFATEGALQAAPLLTVGLHLPFRASSIALDAAPASPTPSPASVAVTAPAAGHRKGWLGEGPIVLQGTGTYQLGVNRSNRNGLAAADDNYASALTLGVERRTEQSAVSITSAFGYGGGAFNAGSLLIGYRTPTYALAYGQVTGPSDSQLQIGGFARGVSLTVPLRNGSVSYLTSTATQAVNGQTETSRVYGVRREWNALGGFFTAGGYYGSGEQGGARQSIADLSFRKFGSRISTTSEIALATSTGLDGVPAGTQLATALQADIQGKNLFTTVALRYDPKGFATLTGDLDGGLSADLALRKHSEHYGDLSLDLGHDDDRSILGDVLHGNRLLFSANKSWRNFGMQFISGVTSSSGSGNESIQRTDGLTFNETLGKVSLFETLQSAATSGTSGTANQRQLSIGVTRPFLGGNLAYQFARNSAGGGGDGSAGSGTANTVTFRRPLGAKLDVQIGQSLQSTENNGVPSRSFNTSISLVRRLSSVVAVQTGAEFVRQTGPGAGRGTIFTASLVGPFGFGQPTTGGRANPKLPAVIRGTVTFAAAPSAFATTLQTERGLNNAIVTLDGKITQRTDSTGEFEFRFVPAGTHTVRLDSATIAPGLIADREYQTVVIGGGQTTTLQFAVGNFAGVSGTVYQQVAGGEKRPLSGIGVAIDGIQAMTTTADGHYQVGRLNPGAHTVELVDATIPSTVAFLGDRKRAVTVSPGTSTSVNFVATALGSIAGTVFAANEGGYGSLAGIHNVYVVAQPGEHAGITDDDGTFLLDNLPPGNYTLTIDPDTLPEGLGVQSGPDGPVDLAGGASVSGIVFKLSAGAKEVVYTFSGGKKLAITVEVSPPVVAPGGLLRIRARTTAKDLKGLFVESDAFGALALRLDPRSGAWLGTTTVPQLPKGDYALAVTARRDDVTDGSALVPVDPSLPLFALHLSPKVPGPGQTVRVTMRSLGNVDEGDALVFEDNYKVVLPKPSGRLFAFDMRIWRHGLPYSATIVTKHGQNYPIVLR